jgi:hypothetical protein
MSHDKYLGRTVVLFQCPASNFKGHDVKATGLFTVEDRYLYEPSAYCHSNGYYLYPVFEPGEGPRPQDEPEDAVLCVDDEQFLPQVDPKAWINYLQWEHQMDIWEWQREQDEKKETEQQPVE